MESLYQYQTELIEKRLPHKTKWHFIMIKYQSLKKQNYNKNVCVCLGTQLCRTLCDPWTVAHQAPVSMGILQARTLEWIDVYSFRGSSQPRDWAHVFGTEDRFFTIWVTRENILVRIETHTFRELEIEGNTLSKLWTAMQSLQLILKEKLLKTGNGSNWESMLYHVNIVH